MTQISSKSRTAAAAAARAYLSGQNITRTTRANPALPRRMTIAEIAHQHHATEPLTKKYIALLRAGKKLPCSANKGGQPPALTASEERALVTFIRGVEKSAFAVTERCIRNYASFLRKHRIDGPKNEVSQAWVRRFKQRHPELHCKSPKVKEVIRAGAELNISSLEAWYQEFEALINSLGVSPANLWNFDETPLQLGWADSSVRIFSTRMKKSTRPVTFQPGNKESLTSVDAVSAGGKSIPSFLILTGKVLLEEYAMATIDESVILTYTSSGFNNAHRARQWLQHFNHHSFTQSDDFKGFSIEAWFGYTPDITREKWSHEVANIASQKTRKEKPVFRMLIMDGFSAHEDPDFIWYCHAFDIIPFRLPAHISHLMQPLDVGVYQHLKREQRAALGDFIQAGGTQISRYDFLNHWNRLYRAAFKACHIYAGFEKAGLMPMDREAVLGPLRQAAKHLEEPLFPKILQSQAVTPRKAKKDLAAIQKQRKLEVLSSPTRATISHAEACLDLAIITQSAQKRIVQLQQERLALEARRTRTRRRIQVSDGVFTLKELREKVTARAHEEWNKEAMKQKREQEDLLRQLRKEASEEKRDIARPEIPHLRGRTAALKFSVLKAFEESILSRENRDKAIPEEDKVAIRNLQTMWNEATEEKRFLISTTAPEPTLQAIPEVVKWRAAKEAASNNEAESTDKTDSGPGDYISIISSVGLPSLPSEGGSESTEIEVITTTQIGSTTRTLFRFQEASFEDDSHGENEATMQEVNYGGFGYDRAPNRYSDDDMADPSVEVGGLKIAVPKSRRRRQQVPRQTENTIVPL